MGRTVLPTIELRILLVRGFSVSKPFGSLQKAEFADDATRRLHAGTPPHVTTASLADKSLVAGGDEGLP